jgi:hypothetical protein
MARDDDVWRSAMTATESSPTNLQQKIDAAGGAV